MIHAREENKYSKGAGKNLCRVKGVSLLVYSLVGEALTATGTCEQRFEWSHAQMQKSSLGGWAGEGTGCCSSGIARRVRYL